jgi:molecular chaperone GrpE
MPDNQKTSQPQQNEAGGQSEKAAEAKLSPQDKKIAELEEALLKKQAESDQWKNKYYLAYADLDNLRKELEKDHREAIKYRAEGFLENLIPALDSFYLALGAKPMTPEAQNYQQGFQYIYNNIYNVLVAEGVSELNPPLGSKFDPQLMHAVETIPSDGPEGLVVKVLAKGYKLKDRLVRPAMVSVSCKKPDEKKEADKPAAEAHKA